MADRKRWDAGASYSGVAFQMGAIIALGTYGGIKLDERLNLSPILTIVFALLSIALSMYTMIKKLDALGGKRKKD